MPRSIRNSGSSSTNAPGGLLRETALHHMIEIRPHFDAVVVGARCAGAATALLLARAGLRVLAVDRQAYGSDTLSTHALMRPAVLQLSRWNLLEPLIRGGSPVIAAARDGSVVIAQITQKTAANPSELAAKKDGLRATLLDEKTNVSVSAFVRQLRDSSTITPNSRMIEALSS